VLALTVAALMLQSVNNVGDAVDTVKTAPPLKAVLFHETSGI
jgi:hypothetical protein